MSVKKEPFSYSKKLLLILLSIVAVLLFLHFVLQYFNLVRYDEQYGPLYEITNRFDLDDEVSLPTWYTQVLFLFIAGLAYLSARLESKKATKIMWLIIASGGLIISIDEGSGFHEYVLQSVHNVFFRDQAPTALANAWLVVLPFILIGSFWLVYKMIKVMDSKTTIFFAVAIAVFIIGAVGVDQLESYVEKSSYINQGLLVGIEEGFEMIAACIVIYAISFNLEKNHRKKISNSIKELTL